MTYLFYNWVFVPLNALHLFHPLPNPSLLWWPTVFSCIHESVSVLFHWFVFEIPIVSEIIKVFVFLVLIYPNTFQVYPCGCKWPGFIPFMANTSYSDTYIHTQTHHIFIHSAVDRHLICSHILATVNNAALNIELHRSLSNGTFYL